MKKIVTVLLAMTLLLQVFTFTALAAELSVEITLDTVKREVVVEIKDLVPNAQYSFRGFYNDIETLDYLDQFQADEEGTAEVKYPSRQEAWVGGDTIIVYINNNDFSIVIPVDGDDVYAEGIEINAAGLVSLKVKTSLDLTATIYPDNATVKTVKWESSNPAIATVVDGKVTALKTGTVIIKATVTNPDETSFEYTIMIRVTA